MEKAHDVSVDEPSAAHQVILFILDVLIRNGQEMEVDCLYQTFGDTSFTPQMLRAIGNSEDGLKTFLRRYPSLFTISTTTAKLTTNDKDVDEDTKITVRANSGADSASIFDFFHQPASIMASSSIGIRSLASENSGSANNSYRPFFRPSSFGARGPQYNSKYTSDSSGLGHLILGNDNTLNMDSKSMKEIEQEALTFFKKQMTRKEEEWLPIVSVAGHASQASSNIRKFVGPQNEFIHFLKKYPEIFVVRDEFCGLKGKADRPHVRFPPPSPPPKRRSSDNTMSIGRSISFNKQNMMNSGGRFFNGTSKLNTTVVSSTTNDGVPAALGLSANSNNHPSNYSSCQGEPNVSTPSSMHLQLSPLEVKAVHYIMRLLHRCGKTLVQNVPALLSRAPEPLIKTIGQTRDQCVQFFKIHSAIFQLHPDSCVSVKQDAVRALIHKDKSLTENSVFTSSGIILRIFPKYGILNTENNEQVFFDIQSCQFESFGDLACILHPGDRLWFNAILGPKDGSTKWRSLKTWIKTKTQIESQTSQQRIGDKATIKSTVDHADSDGTCAKRNVSNTGSSCSKNLQAAINSHFGYANHEGEHHNSGRRFSSDGISSKSSVQSECTSNSRGKLSNDVDLEQYELANDTSVHTDSMSFALNVSSTTSEDDDRSVFGTNDHATSKTTGFKNHHKLIERLNRKIKRSDNQKNGWGAAANLSANDSLKSTSMIDLRSLTSSLPVLATSHDRIGFVPIGCKSQCLDFVRSSSHNLSNPSLDSDAIKICVDPRILQKQVCSECPIGISDRLMVDENHVSVSVQTVSTGEILATNIFVE